MEIKTSFSFLLSYNIKMQEDKKKNVKGNSPYKHIRKNARETDTLQPKQACNI